MALAHPEALSFTVTHVLLLVERSTNRQMCGDQGHMNEALVTASYVEVQVGCPLMLRSTIQEARQFQWRLGGWATRRQRRARFTGV